MPRLLYLILLTLLVWPDPSAAFSCSGRDLLPGMPQTQRQSIHDQAAAMPYAEGLLWRASRGDTEFVIFGTLHLPHRKTQAHFDALMPHARRAQISWFEMNAPDTRRFQTKTASRPDILFNVAGPTLPELLEENEWQRLRVQMAKRGFPAFLTAKLKPVYVSMMLGIDPCHMKSMQAGQHGIDRRLSEALEREGIDTRSIEDTMTLMRVLDACSAADQVAFIRLSLNFPFAPEDMMETMYRAYVAEKPALVWQFGRDLSLRHGGPDAHKNFEQFENILLDRRNQAWIKRLMKDGLGKRNFVAVGVISPT